LNIFDVYSQYYDLLYQDKNYADEAEYVSKHIRAYVPGATRVLELGCGTGGHAVHLAMNLAMNGYTVCGVDLSDSMLERAKVRRELLATEIAEKLTFVHGNLRTVRMEETFDAVISLFHVMSYQTTTDDLEAAFATVATHLRRGGVFIFDFWYGPAVLAQRPKVSVKRLEDESIHITRIAEPELYANENIVNVSYHIWVAEKGSGRVDQIRETHRMRYLFLPEVIRLIEAYGFKSWEAEEWMTGRKPGLDSWGVCVRAYR